MAAMHASAITTATIRVAGQVPTDITVRLLGALPDHTQVHELLPSRAASAQSDDRGAHSCNG